MACKVFRSQGANWMLKRAKKKCRIIRQLNLLLFCRLWTHIKAESRPLTLKQPHRFCSPFTRAFTCLPPAAPLPLHLPASAIPPHRNKMNSRLMATVLDASQHICTRQNEDINQRGFEGCGGALGNRRRSRGLTLGFAAPPLIHHGGKGRWRGSGGD